MPDPTPDKSLVALLTRRPAMVARLAREHVNDGTGQCRGCTGEGETKRNYPWPCSIQLSLDEARRQLKADR